jgi:hypothetical protein
MLYLVLTRRRNTETNVAMYATTGETSATATKDDGASALYDPAARDAKYKGNWAQYLVDLHDAKGTFDFCGGMMFQLVLSERLRSRLVGVAATSSGEPSQPVVFDARNTRMSQTPGYSTTADADNVKIFHGREVRQVPDAAGGMGFVLHLSDTEEDPEGWSPQEIADYNGWRHDSGRPWRNMQLWESEGAKLREKFGEAAFGLHHRFYLHLDQQNGFWLSAEDGCEGRASDGAGRGKLFGLL